MADYFDPGQEILMNFEFKFVLLTLPVLVFLWMVVRYKYHQYKMLFTSIAVLVFFVYAFNLARGIVESMANPPEWDFLTFWVDGQVAARGENFYSVSNYQNLQLPYEPSQDFKREILDVGFRYPPFTMFLFLPLGYLEYGTAYVFWQVCNAILCFVSIGLLWRLYLRDDGIWGLSFILALFFMLRATFSTFFFAQTNFIALAFFLLFWHYRKKDWSGVFLALGFVVKPYLALIYLYPVLARRWKQLAVAFISLFGISVISVMAFGMDVFTSYIVGNSLGNMPAYVYSEPVNQSLLAVLLRSPFSQPMTGSVLSQPLYLGSALIVAVVTLLAGLKGYRNDEWLLVSILFFAFLVYPATLEHYGVFLVIPVLILLKDVNRNWIGKILVFMFVLTLYFFSGIRSGYYTFFANALVWMMSIVFVLRLHDIQSVQEIKKKFRNYSHSEP
jgi:hypothetical protein